MCPSADPHSARCTSIDSLIRYPSLIRPQTPVEAPWSSNTLRTLFPGAQWLGDGTDIGIRWGDKLFVFNLEAVLDVATTAVIGVDVSKSENEKALHHAYEEGKITSGGAPPLCRHPRQQALQPLP